MINKIGIYVHIPFCESKCIYCDFASSVENEKIIEKYFDSLIEEINSCEYVGRVETIYFGGGTPSCVNPRYIQKILTCINQKFYVEKNAEITIECNPNSATFDKLKEYKTYGFNRISFGVQSLHDEMLKLIGRRHNSTQVFEALSNAQKAGFENISADLLIGLPDQKKSDLIEDAQKLINQKVKHISAYMLQIEENTVLFQKIKKGEIILPSEEYCVEMYNALVDFLEKNGVNRYEISNFCRDGWFSRHNLNYWKLGQYLGFGLSAHSYFDGKRFANSRDMIDYLNRKGIFSEEITTQEHIEEMIMLGLRCREGVDISKLKKLGYDIKNNAYYAKFIKEKIIFLDKNILHLNPKYYGVSNTIICDLLPN